MGIFPVSIGISLRSIRVHGQAHNRFQARSERQLTYGFCLHILFILGFNISHYRFNPKNDENNILQNVRRLKYLTPLLFLLILSGCDSGGSNDDSDELSASSLIGTYDLLSMTDISGDWSSVPGQQITAGEDFDVEFPADDGTMLTVTFNIDAVLTLQASQFSISFTSSATFPDNQTQSETETSTGTWTLNGNTITITENDEPSESIALTVDGDQLTLNDPEVKMVFQKR